MFFVYYFVFRVCCDVCLCDPSSYSAFSSSFLRPPVHLCFDVNFNSLSVTTSLLLHSCGGLFPDPANGLAAIVEPRRIVLSKIPALLDPFGFTRRGVGAVRVVCGDVLGLRSAEHGVACGGHRHHSVDLLLGT